MATCGKCKQAGVSTAHVKACYSATTSTSKASNSGKAAQVPPTPSKGTASTTAPIGGKLASDKQCAFAAKLGSERQVPAANSGTDPFPYVERYEDLLERHGAIVAGKLDDLKVVTSKEASKVIDWLLALPKAEGAKGKVVTKAADAPTLDDGVYRLGETIFMVYHTVHGQNVQVAKELIITMVGQNEDGTTKYEGEFEYRGKKPLYSLKPEHKLSEEEAAEFGKVYGFCIRCARTLTKDESKYVGYGATCAGHEGWWYPTKAELKEIQAVTI